VGEKKIHSTFRIKLTKYPTKEDETQPGYHPAFKVEDINDPITG